MAGSYNTSSSIGLKGNQIRRGLIRHNIAVGSSHVKAGIRWHRSSVAESKIGVIVSDVLLPKWMNMLPDSALGFG